MMTLNTYKNIQFVFASQNLRSAESASIITNKLS